MFERFTDRARRVFALANQEAQRFQLDAIGTEHVLLGLLKEGSGVGVNVLKNLDVDIRRLREEVESHIRVGADTDTTRKREQSPAVKRLIEHAVAESRGLGHNYVGTEHVLLGLLHSESDSCASSMFERFDIRLDEVREEIENVLGQGSSSIAPPVSFAPRIPIMFERFSDRARKVMALANQEAQRFNHEYIGTEHILLGLIKEGASMEANVLKNFGADLTKARQEVEKLVKSGPDMVTMGKLPQTPRTKKVIEYAIDEARNLNNYHVGTEHLLLGLIREEDGVAAQVLINLSISLSALREEILGMLKLGPPNPAQGESSKVGKSNDSEPARNEDALTVRGLQDLIEQMYSAKDRKRGSGGTFLWLMEEVGELATAVREGTQSEKEGEFADVLAWLVTLANVEGIDLTTALRKYTGGCPGCGKMVCTCNEKP